MADVDNGCRWPVVDADSGRGSWHGEQGPQSESQRQGSEIERREAELLWLPVGVDAGDWIAGGSLEAIQGQHRRQRVDPQQGKANARTEQREF